MISPEQGDPTPTQKVTFPLGKLVGTPRAMQAVPLEVIIAALVRHGRGDWGRVSPDDWQANQRALVDGGRLLSVYETRDGGRFWIITEGDRSLTTVLLPDEY